MQEELINTAPSPKFLEELRQKITPRVTRCFARFNLEIPEKEYNDIWHKIYLHGQMPPSPVEDDREWWLEHLGYLLELISDLAVEAAPKDGGHDIEPYFSWSVHSIIENTLRFLYRKEYVHV